MHIILSNLCLLILSSINLLRPYLSLFYAGFVPQWFLVLFGHRTELVWHNFIVEECISLRIQSSWITMECACDDFTSNERPRYQLCKMTCFKMGHWNLKRKISQHHSNTLSCPSVWRRANPSNILTVEIWTLSTRLISNFRPLLPHGYSTTVPLKLN